MNGLTKITTNDPAFASAGRELDKIPVPVNYDIIRLFSEGLYRSPHKAVEELVSNGYDAGAERVHVLLPEEPGDATDSAPLWVIDDGHGMDADGFRQLWRVAESKKNGPSSSGRPPIGQFGIGKLAAYVLAWKLTHVSRMDGGLLLTSMDFHDVVGRRQSDASAPVRISLREVNETEAKSLLAEIEKRDREAWNLMFDEQRRRPAWTAVALSDFKELYRKLSAGRLRWILSTGLPLHTDFRIRLDGEPVQSSKENYPKIKTIVLGGAGDTAAAALDGVTPPTAAEVVRQLAAANRDSVALERAVGTAFRVLGFKYERKGGTEPGPDGVLYAHLGRHRKALSDYRLVYDTKQTSQPSVPADKIDLASLENFRKQAKADFGFFIATKYAAEEDDAGTLNEKILANDAYRPLTLLKVDHLRRLVRLHYRHGVTLTELRSLFEKARTTSQVRDWLDSLEEKLQRSQIPVQELLHGLELEKSDPKATPNVYAVRRAKNQTFREFEPERLLARLKAVENLVGVRWIEVEEDSGNVLMHQTAGQILAEVERNIGDLDTESSEDERGVTEKGR